MSDHPVWNALQRLRVCFWITFWWPLGVMFAASQDAAKRRWPYPEADARPTPPPPPPPAPEVTITMAREGPWVTVMLSTPGSGTTQHGYRGHIDNLEGLFDLAIRRARELMEEHDGQA